MLRNLTRSVCLSAGVLEKTVSAAIIAVVTVGVSAAGQAGQSRPVLSVPDRDDRVSADILHDGKVISAIKTAWKDSGIGRIGLEGGFRLDGSPSDYKMVTLRRSNEFKYQSISIVPGVTFAVFHVHPTEGDPRPSETDRKIADQYKFKITTIHLYGIYEYDPATRQTTLVGDLVKLLNSNPARAAGSAGIR